MRNALCRLTVQHVRDDACHEVDLALPRSIHLCQLLPSIVELTYGTNPAPTGTRWRLYSVDGQPIEESMTLDQNEIDDGAMLLLTTSAPPGPTWVPGDVSHLAAQLVDTDERTALLPVAGALIAAAVAATTLGWAAAPMSARLVTAVGLVVVAAVTAVVVDRTHTDGPLGSTLSMTAVMFAAAAGFVAVPAEPAAASVLLSAAAAMAVAMVLLRLTRCATTWLTAIAAAAALTAAVTGAAVAWHLQPATVGAALAVVSLAALAAAPRISMAVAGIGPSPPGIEEPEPQVHQVTRAHRVLTGLVAGAATTATLGSAVVTFEASTGNTARASAAAFVAVMALVLLLRTRSHADPARRTALGMSGIVMAAGCFVIVVAATPGQAHWLSLLAAVAGAAGLSRLLGPTVGPVGQRLVEVTEYVAVAAVVPLACWVAGVYGGVRAMGVL